jgi:hypothetical protein
MKIELNVSKWARAEQHSVALPESGIFEFVSDTYKLDDLVIQAKNGKKTKTVKSRDGKADLTDLMFAGELKMAVYLIIKGKDVKRWDVSPLLITETDGEVYAFDEVTELRNRIEELEKKTTVIM